VMAKAQGARRCGGRTSSSWTSGRGRTDRSPETAWRKTSGASGALDAVTTGNCRTTRVGESGRRAEQVRIRLRTVGG
jgi:hypothetical protein